MFIYKNKEVAINFDVPQLNDLFKLMDADRERSWQLSLQAANDGLTRSPKALLLKVNEVKLNVKNIYFIYTDKVPPFEEVLYSIVLM